MSLVLIVVDMIRTFGDKNTESIWNGIRVKNMPPEIQNMGHRRLRMLNNSQTMTMETLVNVHPGEILLEEFLKPMNITA